MRCLTRKKVNRLFSLSAKMPSTCFYNNRLKGIRNQNISVSRSMITITRRTGRRTSLWPARPSASSCSPPPWSPSPSSCPPSLRRCSVTTFLNTTYQFNNRVKKGFSGIHFSHFLVPSLEKKYWSYFFNYFEFFKRHAILGLNLWEGLLCQRIFSTFPASKHPIN